MKFRYITIEREYGSGGQQIARELAQIKGIPCYGREIIEAVSKEQNIAVDRIDYYEENVTNSFLYTVFALGKAFSGDVDMLTKEGHIFVAEQGVIRRMAEEGPAIFVGHCAVEALKDSPGLLRVFIRCGAKEKRSRIVHEYGIAENKVDSMIHKYDHKRSNYYYANTAKKWKDFNNYDVILDSGVLGVAGCVYALEGLL